MPTLAKFLHGLFQDGRIVLDNRPVAVESERAAALAVLAAEFESHRLDLAGDPIPFDPETALIAGSLIRQLAWFLVNRSEPVEVMERLLVIPKAPNSASEHLSADLTFRFLPLIYRRARSISPDDRLSLFLKDLLKAWPLSGVLSDLAEGPESVGELGGHPGLWMLYAERLALSEKPEWMIQGAARGHIELVFQGLGKGSSPLLVSSKSEGVSLG
jgi:hypothetical protein